jgi:DNA-binding PadR family transcriptional regulator
MNQDFYSFVLPSSLELDILTVFSISDSLYGLEILELINCARSQFDYPFLSIASLYPALNRLADQGFLELTLQRGHAARCKYYRLSDLGDRYFSAVSRYRASLLD